jgi:hypothetical protein
MKMPMPRLWGLLVVAAAGLSACNGGINAGGETETSNGGIAFIALTAMLILTGVILWLILGRDD